MSITIYPSQFNMREDGSYAQLPAIKGETGEQGVPGVGALPGGTAGQVPVKQSADDYDVAWEDIGWTKVWENASPASNFSEQDVAINLSGYSELLIPFTRNAYVQSGWNIVQTAHFNITDMEGAAVTCNAVYDANGRIGRRIISSISSTGFHVAGGNKMTSYGGGYSADDSILVPLFVYAR